VEVRPSSTAPGKVSLFSFDLACDAVSPMLEHLHVTAGAVRMSSQIISLVARS
jgi:hypothetical protein